MKDDEREHGTFELYDVASRNIIGFASCACQASKMAREFVRDNPKAEFILGVDGCHGYRVVRRYGPSQP